MATQSKKTSKTNTSKSKKTSSVKKTTKSTKTTKSPKTSQSAVATKRLSVKTLTRFRRNGAKPKKSTKQLTAAALVTWQKWLALLFAAQGVVVLLLSTTKLIPVTGNYLAEDPLASQGGEVVRVPAVSQLFDVEVAYLVAGVCFVFALAALLSVTLYRAAYEQALARKANRFRWTTFSFGLGGLMMLVGLLAGIQSVTGLLMLFALTVIVCMAGLGLELVGLAQPQVRSVLSGIGTIAWLGLWAVIALYFVYAGVYEGSIPNYLYLVAATALVLSVALVSVLRRQQLGVGALADYMRAERAYLLISFILVSAVVWQVYLGALQP